MNICLETSCNVVAKHPSILIPKSALGLHKNFHPKIHFHFFFVIPLIHISSLFLAVLLKFRLNVNLARSYIFRISLVQLVFLLSFTPPRKHIFSTEHAHHHVNTTLRVDENKKKNSKNDNDDNRAKWHEKRVECCFYVVPSLTRISVKRCH